VRASSFPRRLNISADEFCQASDFNADRAAKAVGATGSQTSAITQSRANRNPDAIGANNDGRFRVQTMFVDKPRATGSFCFNQRLVFYAEASFARAGQFRPSADK
jgi:hypothetical protein